MINELTFTTNSLFDSVLYDEDADSWCFLFKDKIYASSCVFWRLLVEGKIVYVSLDQGHQFGLPKPLDLVTELTKLLTGKYLLAINIDKNTADLSLTISEGIKIEIYIASSGYETYNLSYRDKRYIGLGSGEIAIFENK